MKKTNDPIFPKSIGSDVPQPKSEQTTEPVVVAIPVFVAPITNEKTDMSAQHNDIARRAYYIWQEEGSPEKENDLHDWLQAEAALSNEQDMRFTI